MITVNGDSREFLDEPIASLLERMAIDTRGVAVAVDGDVIRRAEWLTTRVHDGAKIEIVTAVAGG